LKIGPDCTAEEILSSAHDRVSNHADRYDTWWSTQSELVSGQWSPIKMFVEVTFYRPQYNTESIRPGIHIRNNIYTFTMANTWQSKLAAL